MYKSQIVSGVKYTIIYKTSDTSKLEVVVWTQSWTDTVKIESVKEYGEVTFVKNMEDKEKGIILGE